MVTFKEYLLEISAKTLRSYRKKAKEDYIKRSYEFDPDNKNLKKLIKRTQGHDLAGSKLGFKNNYHSTIKASAKQGLLPRPGEQNISGKVRR